MATKVQVIKTFSLDSKLPGHPTLIGSPEQRWLPMISKWKAKITFFFFFTSKVSLERRVIVLHTLEGHSTIYTWHVSYLYSIPSLILWESVEALDEVWVFNTKFHVSQAYISCHGVKVVGYLCSLAYKSQSQKVECHLERYIFMVLKGTHLVTRVLLNYYEISYFLSHYVLFSVCALIMIESTMMLFKKAKKKNYVTDLRLSIAKAKLHI